MCLHQWSEHTAKYVAINIVAEPPTILGHDINFLAMYYI